mmetsp:Transcript_16998/g.42132  ORF Transcript_16998/g.42132 Transcript_16998/m.42132 type:complete len:261 (+) Transcript_16998:480-1262(+)
MKRRQPPRGRFLPQLDRRALADLGEDVVIQKLHGGVLAVRVFCENAAVVRALHTAVAPAARIVDAEERTRDGQSAPSRAHCLARRRSGTTTDSTKSRSACPGRPPAETGQTTQSPQQRTPQKMLASHLVPLFIVPRASTKTVVATTELRPFQEAERQPRDALRLLRHHFHFLPVLPQQIQGQAGSKPARHLRLPPLEFVRLRPVVGLFCHLLLCELHRDGEEEPKHVPPTYNGGKGGGPAPGLGEGAAVRKQNLEGPVPH